MNEVSIENLLNEYDKCVMSKLINKEYKFEELKKIVKTFSEQTGFIKYSDEMLEHASKMEFEQAAELRDKIKELEKLL